MSKPLSQLTSHHLPNPIQEAAERDREAGQTLLELERRQDDVLLQLEDLDQKLNSILRGLGVTISDEDLTHTDIRLAELGTDDDSDEDQCDRELIDNPAVSAPAIKIFAIASASRRAA